MAWYHLGCNQSDYIDGRGMILCGCAGERCLFDLRFICSSKNRTASYDNYLDARKSINALNITLSVEWEGDIDCIETFVNNMMEVLRQRAKAKGILYLK